MGGKCQNSKIQMRHFVLFSNIVYLKHPDSIDNKEDVITFMETFEEEIKVEETKVEVKYVWKLRKQLQSLKTKLLKLQTLYLLYLSSFRGQIEEIIESKILDELRFQLEAIDTLQSKLEFLVDGRL